MEMEKEDDRTRTAMLVLSQMFFTVFGSLANIFVFIILRDLPSLSSSTYNILLLNLTATNLIICTIVKPMSSVFVSYSFAQVRNIFYTTTCLIFCLRLRAWCPWSSAPSTPPSTGSPSPSVPSPSSPSPGISSSAAAELPRGRWLFPSTPPVYF